MPVSHDTKPRNRHRHMDITKRNKPSSKRGLARRVLWRDMVWKGYVEANLRNLLASNGKNWRWFERQPRKEKTDLYQTVETMMINMVKATHEKEEASAATA